MASRRLTPKNSTFAIFAWSMASIFLPLVAFATSYVYDDNGRLRAVTNSSGTSSQYLYDSVGNLLRVTNVAASQLAVFAFTPGQGPFGTSVRIYGQGFSTTLASDIVKFNGLQASVTSATTNQLVATVPNLATTGPISVTVGTNTATSSDAFLISSADHSPPSISGFVPLVALAGTSVTVTGNNLAPITNATVLRVNSRVVPISASPPLTDSQATFVIPQGVGSGKVVINTPFGQATSTNDLIVAPGGSNPADIVSSTRILIDGSVISSTIPANKTSVLLFDAGRADWLSLQSVGSAPALSYTIYDPLNIRRDPYTGYWPTIHLSYLDTSGTYAVFLQAGASPTSFDFQLERNASILVDGPPVTITSSVPNLGKRFVFAGAIRQSLGLGITNIYSSAPGTRFFPGEVRRQDGTLWPINTTFSCGEPSPGCETNVPNLPASEVLSAAIIGAGTFGFTATLSSDLPGSLILNTPFNLNITRPGQNGRLTFNWPSAQLAAVSFTGVNPPVGTNIHIQLYDANNTLLYSFTAANGSQQLGLLQAGSYTLLVDPSLAYTLSMTVTLIPGS